MLKNIIEEAYCGNFSIFILVVNILQLIVALVALAVAVIAIKRGKK